MNGRPALTCRDERRRRDVRAAEHLNGLDYLEVGDDQLTLTVFLLGKAPESMGPENVVIRGCESGAREVRVVDLRLFRLADPEQDDYLVLTVDRPGSFSPYTLCLVELDERGRPTGNPFPGFDPRYDCLPLDWKIGCPSDLDCKVEPPCPPEPREEPEINYLAKDYSSFRQAILDRLAVILPDWRERHVPDLGIALVELLAYAGDHLSYYQDAVATEAYLGTARRRISVRRHARLVDYPMHEGCNARTWVFVCADGDYQLPAQDFYCITEPDPAPPPAGKPLADDELSHLPGASYEVFEPLAADPGKAIKLRKAHNEIQLYTWGDRECCLSRGATRATLCDGPPRRRPLCDGAPGNRLYLEKDDLLLFEEVKGPQTGIEADADPAHRHVVRLVRVTPGVDALYGRTEEQEGQPVLEIDWAPEDALPFPLCLSAVGRPSECALLTGVSVARGNLFLADHGRTIVEEPLSDSARRDLGEPPWTVPPAPSVPRCEAEGQLSEVAASPGRFNISLQLGPITFCQPLPAGAKQMPAARLLVQDPRQALPAVILTAKLAPAAAGAWSAQPDLLGSGPDDPHFVVEVDDDGRGQLRFGDGELGRPLLPGMVLTARYRVGNGPSGDIGAGALRHLVLRNAALSGASLAPRNPLPARGGTAPEPLAEVRLLAPDAFRAQLERAVTADDYAALVERDFAGRVLRAAATLRWTGSWTEVLVAVDPSSAETDVSGLLEEIRQALHRYRRLGHDVVVQQAASVALDVGLTVHVLPHFLRGHVEAALLDELGNRTLPDGRRGFFHPDNLILGQGIALSRLVAAAQAVAGVESVEVTKFQRLNQLPNQEIENGFLPLGPLEMARLDNDRRFPNHGRLQLEIRGGR
ncbi:MAG TPA: putative baseplate assembly protein [Thermoanaerobaculia bacterium]|nr:putative baseplate assembly protein [Thermoanaerobaculia bacterium]